MQVHRNVQTTNVDEFRNKGNNEKPEIDFPSLTRRSQSAKRVKMRAQFKNLNTKNVKNKKLNDSKTRGKFR